MHQQGGARDRELHPKTPTDQDAVEAFTRQRDCITQAAADTRFSWFSCPLQRDQIKPQLRHLQMTNKASSAVKKHYDWTERSWTSSGSTRSQWDSLWDLRGTTYVQPPPRFKFALQQVQHAILRAITDHGPSFLASEPAWKVLVLSSWLLLGRPAVNAFLGEQLRARLDQVSKAPTRLVSCRSCSNTSVESFPVRSCRSCSCHTPKDATTQRTGPARHACSTHRSGLQSPHSVLQYLRAGQVTPLAKPTGGHKPLLMMSFLRRLALKSVMAGKKESVAKCAGPLQYGVGRPDGANTMIKTIQYLAEADNSRVLVALELKAAFQNVSRRAMLHSIEKSDPDLAPVLFPMVHWNHRAQDALRVCLHQDQCQ